MSDAVNTALTFHMFADGIVPIWEDGANRAGGKWSIRLKKGTATRMWEEVLLAVVGNRFACASAGLIASDEVCGAVLATKFNEDVLSVWNRSAQSQSVVTAIRDVLRKVLNAPANAFEYAPHETALKNTPR